MRKALLKYLACPECLSEAVNLHEAPHENLNQCNRIGDGFLLCRDCGRLYPIIEGIPYLMTDAFRDEVLTNESTDSVDADGQLDAQVTIANIRFHNKVADLYETDLSTKGVFTPFTQNRMQEALQFIAASTSAELLLDMGCGTGNVLRSASRLFKLAIGTDISVSMIRKPVTVGLDAVIGSCTRSPYKSGCADGVSAFSVLHHLLEPKDFFQEAYRLLKRGGWIYTDWDPNAESAERLQRLKLAGDLRKAYGKILSWVFSKQKKGTTFHSSSEDVEALAQLAEYHHHYSNGFRKDEMQQVLREIGFRDVRIIRHWNSNSFEGPQLHKIPLEQRLVMLAKMIVTFCFNPSSLAPNIMILARK